MQNKNLIVWIILMLLTLATALLAGASKIAYLMLGISAVKFLLVAFQFMELKKAHAFWESALVILLTTISAVILLLVA